LPEVAGGDDPSEPESAEALALVVAGFGRLAPVGLGVGVELPPAAVRGTPDPSVVVEEDTRGEPAGDRTRAPGATVTMGPDAWRGEECPASTATGMPITSITRVAATPARTLRRCVIPGGNGASPGDGAFRPLGSDDDRDPVSASGTGSKEPTSRGRTGRFTGDVGGTGDGSEEPGGGNGIRPAEGGAGGWSSVPPTGCTSTGSRKMTSLCLTNDVGRPKTYRRRS